MKLFFQVIALVILLPTLAVADEYKIAVVDMETAIASSNQYKQWKSQLEGKYSKEQERLKTLAEEGNSLKEKAQKEGDFLSEDERKALVVQIQQKFNAFQQLKAGLGQQMKAQEQQFLAQLRPKVEAIVRDMVAEKKVDIILNRRTLVFAKPELDLTAAVISELNK